MINKFARRVGVLGLAVALLAIPALTTAQQAGQGLEISPPLVDLEADPGQTIETQIRITNVTNQTLVARAHYNDFVAGDEEGTPDLILPEEGETEESPYSIRDWIEEIPEFTLEGGERQIFNFVLNVPEDASPGGHYGVIRFTGAPPEVDESAVSLSASVGTLVLVTVSGDIVESAGVAEIYTSQNGNQRNFFEYGPIDINTRLENTGNVHVQPSGTMRITDMFGNEVDTFKFNEDKRNVLPSSIRRFENTLDRKLLFGRYKIQADIVYGDSNSIITASKTFWVIPYKLIAIGLVGLVLLILGVRRYNKHIVKRAQKGHGHEPKKKADSSKNTKKKS